MNSKLLAIPTIMLLLTLSITSLANAQTSNTNESSVGTPNVSCSQVDIENAKQGISGIRDKISQLKSQYYNDWQTASNSGQYHGTWEKYAQEKLSSAPEVIQLKSDYMKFSSILKNCGAMSQSPSQNNVQTQPSTTCSQDDITHAKEELATSEKQFGALREKINQDYQQAHNSGEYNGTLPEYIHDKFYNSTDVLQMKATHDKYSNFLKNCIGQTSHEFTRQNMPSQIGQGQGFQGQGQGFQGQGQGFGKFGVSQTEPGQKIMKDFKTDVSKARHDANTSMRNAKNTLKSIFKNSINDAKASKNDISTTNETSAKQNYKSAVDQASKNLRTSMQTIIENARDARSQAEQDFQLAMETADDQNSTSDAIKNKIKAFVEADSDRLKSVTDVTIVYESALADAKLSQFTALYGDNATLDGVVQDFKSTTNKISKDLQSSIDDATTSAESAIDTLVIGFQTGQGPQGQGPQGQGPQGQGPQGQGPQGQGQ